MAFGLAAWKVLTTPARKFAWMWDDPNCWKLTLTFPVAAPAPDPAPVPELAPALALVPADAAVPGAPAVVALVVAAELPDELEPQAARPAAAPTPVAALMKSRLRMFSPSRKSLARSAAAALGGARGTTAGRTG